MPHDYRQLDPRMTIETIEQLKRRIEERFPDSGLSRVCASLAQVGHQSVPKTAWIARPHRGYRYGAYALIGLGAIGLLGSLLMTELSISQMHVKDYLELLDAMLNDLVLIGAGAVFLVTAESRVKRGRALASLDELRSLAHVIDMHQLHKDPSSIASHSQATASSPVRDLTPYELARYLDYCSEMLALTGKIAALYGQNLPDPAIVGAVNDIENLTTGLSRKIWQKLALIQQDD